MRGGLPAAHSCTRRARIMAHRRCTRRRGDVNTIVFVQAVPRVRWVEAGSLVQELVHFSVLCTTEICRQVQFLLPFAWHAKIIFIMPSHRAVVTDLLIVSEQGLPFVAACPWPPRICGAS